jgi:chemotaxis protein MotB
VPIRTAQFPSNWELSASRATEIVRLLIVRDGFAPDHLSAGGFAEYHPVASNTTPEGRGMNRRVDIVVLGAAPKEPPAAQTAAGVHDRNPSAMPAATVPASKTTEPLPIAAPKATMINAAHDPSQN